MGSLSRHDREDEAGPGDTHSDEQPISITAYRSRVHTGQREHAQAAANLLRSIADSCPGGLADIHRKTGVAESHLSECANPDNSKAGQMHLRHLLAAPDSGLRRAGALLTERGNRNTARRPAPGPVRHELDTLAPLWAALTTALGRGANPEDIAALADGLLTQAQQIAWAADREAHPEAAVSEPVNATELVRCQRCDGETLSTYFMACIHCGHFSRDKR